MLVTSHLHKLFNTLKNKGQYWFKPMTLVILPVASNHKVLYSTYLSGLNCFTMSFTPNALIKADALLLLERMNDQSVDLVYLDPPLGISGQFLFKLNTKKISILGKYFPNE